MSKPYTAVLTQRTRLANWLDYTQDLADLAFDQFKDLKPYLNAIWVVKLAAKIATRINQSLRSPFPITDLVFDPPLKIVEAIKLNPILNAWFPLADPYGMIFVFTPPMWSKDP